MDDVHNLINEMRRKVIRRKLGKRRGRRPRKASKSFVKKVKKIIHKNVESKQAFATVVGKTLVSGANTSASIMGIMPSIQQSVFENGRVGQQIRLQSLTLKGHFVMSDTTLLGNIRLGVRMMVVSPKSYANGDGAVANYNVWMPGLLKKGGTASAFTGIISDLYAPINTDVVTKYFDKVFYVTTPYKTTGTTSVNTVAELSNTVRFFRKTFKTKRLLKYDPNVAGGIAPVNYGPLLLCGYVKLDGSTPDTVTSMITINYDAIVKYEDA